QKQLQVRRSVLLLSRPVRREDPRGAAQHVDADAGVVREGGKAGVRDGGAGLDERVLREGHPVLHRLGAVVPDPLQVGSRLRDDLLELGDLVLVVGREDDSHDSAPEASAAVWYSVRVAHPATPSSSSASSSRLSNGAPSAVPCTSTNSPRPVTTTFMSVSARTSSTYARSSMGWPSTIPTETAATESSSGALLRPMNFFARPHSIASASAT